MKYSVFSAAAIALAFALSSCCNSSPAPQPTKPGAATYVAPTK